jgi:hypothetical protein
LIKKSELDIVEVYETYVNIIMIILCHLIAELSLFLHILPGARTPLGDNAIFKVF